MVDTYGSLALSLSTSTDGRNNCHHSHYIFGWHFRTHHHCRRKSAPFGAISLILSSMFARKLSISGSLLVFVGLGMVVNSASAQVLTSRYTKLNHNYVFGAGGDSNTGTISGSEVILSRAVATGLRSRIAQAVRCPTPIQPPLTLISTSPQRLLAHCPHLLGSRLSTIQTARGWRRGRDRH